LEDGRGLKTKGKNSRRMRKGNLMLEGGKTPSKEGQIKIKWGE
jgi:hypothetical protein